MFVEKRERNRDVHPKRVLPLLVQAGAVYKRGAEPGYDDDDGDDGDYKDDGDGDDDDDDVDDDADDVEDINGVGEKKIQTILFTER